MPLGVPEVWMRNPRNYVRECVEAGAHQLVWDMGFLRKSRIDPRKFADLYFGESVPWRALLIGSNEALLIDTDHGEQSPKEVFPVWRYGQDINHLEVHANTQDRIVLSDLPPAGTGLGRQTLNLLNEIQEDYPDCKLHVHGLYSYRTMFGLSFQSVDTDPRTTAQKGRIYLPTGKEVYYESTLGEPHWVHLLGMRPVDLRIPRNRCIFNIKSAVWAASHFKDAIKIETRDRKKSTDPNGSEIPTSQSIYVRRIAPSRGDKFLCNMCTLQTACKYFREGQVCIVPGSEPVELAKFFKTRDSGEIIEGLGTLLAAQSRRLAKALETEEVEEKLLPETTKIINTMFDRGVKLAKLVDPTLAASGAARINLQFGDTNNTQINAATPQALMAAIVDEFVRRGIPREQITPEMVMKVFESPKDLQQKAIEAAAAEKAAS